MQSKMAGGLEFRDFDCFNRTLLAKQCSKFITRPDTLVACLLKSKYYFATSFLNAVQSNGAS